MAARNNEAGIERVAVSVYTRTDGRSSKRLEPHLTLWVVARGRGEIEYAVVQLNLLLGSVTPLGADAVTAVKLEVLALVKLPVCVKDFLKYANLAAEPNVVFRYSFVAFSVTNAVELSSVNSESFDISLTLYPFKVNEPVTSAEPVN